LCTQCPRCNLRPRLSYGLIPDFASEKTRPEVILVNSGRRHVRRNPNGCISFTSGLLFHMPRTLSYLIWMLPLSMLPQSAPLLPCGYHIRLTSGKSVSSISQSPFDYSHLTHLLSFSRSSSNPRHFSKPLLHNCHTSPLSQPKCNSLSSPLLSSHAVSFLTLDFRLNLMCSPSVTAFVSASPIPVGVSLQAREVLVSCNRIWNSSSFLIFIFLSAP